MVRTARLKLKGLQGLLVWYVIRMIHKVAKGQIGDYLLKRITLICSRGAEKRRCLLSSCTCTAILTQSNPKFLKGCAEEGRGVEPLVKEPCFYFL